MSYHCPACNKVSPKALDLARHMMGRGDKVHRDWIKSQGLSYSEILQKQLQSFGGEGFRALEEVIEKKTKVND
jgi:hypothetical protein